MKLKITRRKSKQRDLIKQALYSKALCHPTAEEVCTEVKKTDSSISLGTVYRNLNLMAEMGELQKISGVDASDRFDFYTRPHAHFNCSYCGKVFDAGVILKSSKRLEAEGFIVDSVETLFRGACPRCAKKFHSKKTNSKKKGK